MRTSALLLMTLAAAVTLLAACSAGEAAESPETVAAPAGPSIAFDKQVVDLGRVPADIPSVQTFLVLNRGDETLDVDSPQVRVVSGCDTVEAATGAVTIPPDEALPLPVTMGPHTDLGKHEVAVTLASNDPARPSVDLLLRFDVVDGPPAAPSGPRLRVDKTVIDIGAIPFDWPLYEIFTISNDGDEPLVLDGQPVLRLEEGC